MLEAREQLAFETEAEEGVAETLVAADAILVANAKFTPDVKMNERPNRSSSLSPFAAVPGFRSAQIEFDVEIKGSGVAGTAPPIGELLLACGFAETIVASTSVTYLPASASIPTLTMALYMDGMIHKIWGARGQVTLALKTGEVCWAHFVFTGADFSVADGSFLTGVSYNSTVPPAFLSASLAIDSYAALISKMDISAGNTIQLRPDANASSGHKSAAITARVPAMSFDPEKCLVATYDFYGKLRSGSEGALTAALGGTEGNICTITAPKVQYGKIAEDGRNGLRLLGIDCRLNRDSGDDELSLAFT